MRKISLFGSAVLLGTIVSFQVFAASPPRLFSEERFVINVGALFATDIETTLALQGNDGIGDSIILEDTLGFSDSETVFFVDGWWRFGGTRKHRLIVGNSAINRDSGATIMDEIEIGDTIFPVNAQVGVDFDADMLEFAYAYSFVLSDKTEFAGIIGLHWFTYDFGIRITDLPSAAKGTIGVSESGSLDGPFPNFGLQLRHAFTPNFRGQATIRWLEIDIGDYDGSITDFNIGVTYEFNRTFGLALDWGWFNWEGGVSSGNWRGSLDYKWNGPVLTANFQFGN